MTTTEAVVILARHNKWRRGSDEVEMANPTELGIAIDKVIERIIVNDYFNSCHLELLNKTIANDEKYFSELTDISIQEKWEKIGGTYEILNLEIIKLVNNRIELLKWIKGILEV